MRTHTTDKGDLAYVRARDNGECVVFRFSPAHVLTVDSSGRDRIEMLTTYDAPAWFSRSKSMTPHNAEVTIRKSANISPAFKAVFLQMMDAQTKEVK